MPVSPEKRKRVWKLERKQHHRTVDNSEFYNSWVWRKTRRRYLNKFPLCVKCAEENVVNNATVVDHIVPISVGGCKLCEENFQSMCSFHHNSKSGKEAHGFVDKIRGIGVKPKHK